MSTSDNTSVQLESLIDTQLNVKSFGPLVKIIAVVVAQSERSPCVQQVGCSNTGCDKPKSLKQVAAASLPNVVSVSVTGPRNGCPVSQQAWHSKDPLLFNGHQCRVWVKIGSPLTVMSEKFSSGTKKNPNQQIVLIIIPLVNIFILHSNKNEFFLHKRT